MTQKVDKPEFPIIKLTASHDIHSFNSGSIELNRFLKKYALLNQQSENSQTYVACHGKLVAAYYTLTVGSVLHANAPTRIKKHQPKYPIPVMILARLAIDLKFQGMGLGKALLKNALQRTAQAADIAGIRALLVHAKDDNAIRFYQYFNFDQSPINPKQLFLVMKDIKHIVGQWSSKMKLFLDTADVESIKRAQDTGLLDGVTTNPSHVAKAGKPFQELVKEICDITPGPVSVEAVGETVDEIVAEAKKIHTLAPNIYIKIPMNVEGLKAVPLLERKEIHTNVTMVFSSTQAFLAMKAGATYVSIVLSRLDAYANESEILVNDAVAIKHNYGFGTEVLAGSVKTQNQMLTCLRTGIDIATIPEDLFFQMYKHPLTDMGLDQFLKDWATVQKQRFESFI